MTGPPRQGRQLRRVPWRPLVQLGAFALAVHLLLPQLAGLEATAEALARASWWLSVTVILLEGASLAAYGELVFLVLRSFAEPADRALVQRTTFVGNALGRALPGGTTAALATVLNALGRAGLDPVKTAAALAASGTLSAVVLALLLPAALLLAVVGGDRGAAVEGAAAAALGIAAASLAARPLLRRSAVAGRVARKIAASLSRGPLRGRVNPDQVGSAVQGGLAKVNELVSDPATLRSGAVWALANWLLDLSALVLIAVVIGQGVPLSALPLAYVVAALTAAVPTTPGGVGVVEAVMVATLVGAGAPAGAAAATVLGWRLISHWLPIAVGLALLPTLNGRGRPQGSGRSAERGI